MGVCEKIQKEWMNEKKEVAEGILKETEEFFASQTTLYDAHYKYGDENKSQEEATLKKQLEMKEASKREEEYRSRKIRDKTMEDRAKYLAQQKELNQSLPCTCRTVVYQHGPHRYHDFQRCSNHY